MQLIPNEVYLAHQQLLDAATGITMTLGCGWIGWFVSRRIGEHWLARKRREADLSRKART